MPNARSLKEQSRSRRKLHSRRAPAAPKPAAWSHTALDAARAFSGIRIAKAAPRLGGSHAASIIRRVKAFYLG